MAGLPAHVIHAIVELDGFIPVIHTWMGRKMVVPGSLGRQLGVAVGGKGWRKGLAWHIVEIIVGKECLVRIIILSQIAYACRSHYGMVLPRHVVGHKINDNAHSGFMCTCHQFFKLLHAVGHIHSQVGVNIVIVSDGIGASGLSLHHSGVIQGKAESRIVGLAGMSNHACIPYMRGSHLADLSQGFRCKVGQFARTVLFDRTALHGMGVVIAKQTGEYLIDYRLAHRCITGCPRR